MSCPNCGGKIIGDGYTVVLHCENAEIPAGTEPDATVIYCNPVENIINTKMDELIEEVVNANIEGYHSYNTSTLCSIYTIVKEVIAKREQDLINYISE